MLRAAFAGGGSSGAATSSPTQATTAAQPGITARGASPQATTPVSASAGPSTGGFIQADPSTNSLVITAAEPLYRQVRAMIDQLDSRRAQVYIESMIVEVSGDNAADFGFQWQGLAGSSGDKYGVFAGTNTSISGPSNVALTQTIAGQGTTLPGEGFNIGLLKNYGGTYALAAVARALQTQANTNIVSTPNLITLDNEEAKIVVGENVPFITGQFTNTGTATTSPFQTKRTGAANQVRVLTEMKQRVLQAVDAANPEYAAARNAWEGPTKFLDQIEEGKKILNADSEDIIANFQRLDEGQKEAFRIGVVQAIISRMRNNPARLPDMTHAPLPRYEG